jgi:hypothetical protein
VLEEAQRDGRFWVSMKFLRSQSKNVLLHTSNSIVRLTICLQPYLKLLVGFKMPLVEFGLLESIVLRWCKLWSYYFEVQVLFSYKCFFFWFCFVFAQFTCCFLLIFTKLCPKQGELLVSQIG